MVRVMNFQPLIKLDKCQVEPLLTCGLRTRTRIVYNCAHNSFLRGLLMPMTDPFVDDYIEKAKDFAKPILNPIRELIHEACPDAVETKKWSFPHFDYKGMMCSM